jgi:hypothetical protein
MRTNAAGWEWMLPNEKYEQRMQWISVRTDIVQYNCGWNALHHFRHELIHSWICKKLHEPRGEHVRAHAAK